jgi:adenylate cyclase, class 2
MDYKEIEVKFLEVEKNILVKKLRELGAEDLGDDLLEEVILYDKALTWNGSGKMLRLRTRKGKTFLTYKHHVQVSTDGAEEMEIEVSDQATAQALLERLGYVPYRHQQKKRHTFRLGQVIVDIDTWPRIPTYVELEGRSVEALKDAALQLGFDWEKANTEDARTVIEKVYHIPMRSLRWFTFDHFE